LLLHHLVDISNSFYTASCAVIHVSP